MSHRNFVLFWLSALDTWNLCIYLKSLELLEISLVKLAFLHDRFQVSCWPYLKKSFTTWRLQYRLSSLLSSAFSNIWIVGMSFCHDLTLTIDRYSWNKMVVRESER